MCAEMQFTQTVSLQFTLFLKFFQVSQFVGATLQNISYFLMGNSRLPYQIKQVTELVGKKCTAHDSYV